MDVIRAWHGHWEISWDIELMLQLYSASQYIGPVYPARLREWPINKLQKEQSGFGGERLPSIQK